MTTDLFPETLAKPRRREASILKNDRWVLICSDCESALRAIEPDSIDALVTDPPAGIAFMEPR